MSLVVPLNDNIIYASAVSLITGCVVRQSPSEISIAAGAPQHLCGDIAIDRLLRCGDSFAPGRLP
jgi:hypothetical protein